MTIFTTEQIEAIKNNLAYNYKILDRVLICLSIKSSLLNEEENRFVDVLIDEADKKTLIHRLYEKNAGSYLMDTLKRDEITEHMMRQMEKMFGLDINVLSGKRKLDLGIGCPKGLILNDSSTLADEIVAFNKRHPEWAVELFGTDTNSDYDIREAVWHILRDKEIYMMDHKFSTSSMDELLYNPIGIDGIRAFIYVIDNGMIKFPLDTDSIFKYFTADGISTLIDEFIQQDFSRCTNIKESLNYVDILRNRKRAGRQFPEIIARYEQFARGVFNQIFIFDLFIQIERRIQGEDDFYTRAYKPNVYCLDSLIHYIADSTFDYFYGYRDKGNTVWGFLKQIDTGEKLNLVFPKASSADTDSLDVDLTDINDYIDEEELNNLYEKLTLSVPAPLTLKEDSELLKLIVTVENMGCLTTLSGWNKEISFDSLNRPSRPKFKGKSILQ